VRDELISDFLVHVDARLEKLKSSGTGSHEQLDLLTNFREYIGIDN
jgi:hypothetical protein